ncbi:MAG: aspartyl protease family protein [Caldilineaceae bacterium]
MPVIEVGVSLPKYNTAEVTITALLDSGSDGTLLPVDLLESIGAKPIGPARIRGLWSSSRSASMYLVKLYVGPHQLFAVRVAGIESKDEPILGRNVLNQMVINHNGLAGMVEIVG